jgi:hypothetical protein
MYLVARDDVGDMQFSGLWDKVVPSLTDPSEAGVKVLASSGRPARCLIVVNGVIYDEDSGSGAATCGATVE